MAVVRGGGACVVRAWCVRGACVVRAWCVAGLELSLEQHAPSAADGTQTDLTSTTADSSQPGKGV